MGPQGADSSKDLPISHGSPHLQLALPVAAGHVEADGIAKDKLAGAFHGYRPAAAAQGNHEFDLVMKIVSQHRVGDGHAILHEGISRLLKEERRILLVGFLHFADVVYVVAAHAVDAMDREHLQRTDDRKHVDLGRDRKAQRRPQAHRVPFLMVQAAGPTNVYNYHRLTAKCVHISSLAATLSMGNVPARTRRGPQMRRTQRGRIDEARSAPAEPTNATRSASLVERLRQGLLDGQYPLGQRLNEVQLSRELDVSRTPVRAALQMLAGEGLLHHTPNKGFTVRDFPLSEIVDAYEMRALAEGLAARLATERGLSEDDRRLIEQALVEGDRILTRQSNREARRAGYAQINEMFHSTIHRAAGSDLVKDVVRLCQRMPQASARNVVAFELPDIRERHHAHHRIYDAILGREPREAERLMCQHVLSVKISMVRSVIRRDRKDGRAEPA
jgi:GntR family transcriptional regulator, vanillate catabolism transcriptional regulator